MKITDKDVKDMISGKKNNRLLRLGLCGKDLRNVDMSNLSFEMFQFLSFDSDTIFSPKQIEKFHIEELKNKKIKNYKGGKGVKVAILDTALDNNHEILKEANFEYINVKNKGEIEEHGMAVVSSFLDIAPESEIIYFPYNKYNKNREEKLLEYIKEIADRGDVKIISLSNHFNNKEIREKVNSILKDNNITLIDSNTFYKDFSYYISTLDNNGNQVFNNGFCEYEQKETLNYFIRKKQERDKKQSITEEIIDKNNGNVEVICGGKVYAQNNDKYKYCSYCCASFSIPQVAALFALAREQNSNISYEEFVEISKETVDKIEKDGVLNFVINQERLLEKVKSIEKKEFNSELKENVEKSFLDIPKIEKKLDEQKER